MPRPRPVIDHTHLWVSGNVVIHPTATIAPDVLLQADPDCELVVAAGACIGTGSILHAYEGQLTIESGATLGSGVLVVGHGTIGAEACIGAMSTIIDSSIEANQSVPPGSLIGDRSRQVDLTTVSTFVPPVSPPSPPVSPFVPPVSPPITPSPPVSSFKPPSFSPTLNSSNTNSSNTNSSDTNGAAPPAPPTPAPSPPPPATPAPPTKKAMTQIYGQAYLERIMITMFPYRQHLFEPLADESEKPTDPPAE